MSYNQQPAQTSRSSLLSNLRTSSRQPLPPLPPLQHPRQRFPSEHTLGPSFDDDEEDVEMIAKMAALNAGMLPVPGTRGAGPRDAYHRGGNADSYGGGHGSDRGQHFVGGHHNQHHQQYHNQNHHHNGHNNHHHHQQHPRAQRDLYAAAQQQQQKQQRQAQIQQAEHLQRVQLELLMSNLGLGGNGGGVNNQSGGNVVPRNLEELQLIQALTLQAQAKQREKEVEALLKYQVTQQAQQLQLQIQAQQAQAALLAVQPPQSSRSPSGSATSPHTDISSFRGVSPQQLQQLQRERSAFEAFHSTSQTQPQQHQQSRALPPPDLVRQGAASSFGFSTTALVSPALSSPPVPSIPSTPAISTSGGGSRFNFSSPPSAHQSATGGLNPGAREFAFGGGNESDSSASNGTAVLGGGLSGTILSSTSSTNGAWTPNRGDVSTNWRGGNQQPTAQQQPSSFFSGPTRRTPEPFRGVSSAPPFGNEMRSSNRSSSSSSTTNPSTESDNDILISGGRKSPQTNMTSSSEGGTPASGTSPKENQAPVIEILPPQPISSVTRGAFDNLIGLGRPSSRPTDGFNRAVTSAAVTSGLASESDPVISFAPGSAGGTSRSKSSSGALEGVWSTGVIGGQPVRQPRGPPSESGELGPRNFASRIRKQAGSNLSLLGRREGVDFLA